MGHVQGGGAARGSLLRITLPAGVVVHGLIEGFLGGSVAVCSRKSTRKITKFAPLRDFWSKDCSQAAEMMLCASLPCSMHLIGVEGGELRVRPSCILACDATVVFTSVSWLSSTWVDVSGSGTLAIYSAGAITELAASERPWQYASSRILAYSCETKKAVGGDSSLWSPGVVPCRVWSTTARHGPLLAQHMGRAAAPTASQGISVRAWGSTSLQIFLLALLTLLAILFSDAIESWIMSGLNLNQDDIVRWINRVMAQFK